MKGKNGGRLPIFYIQIQHTAKALRKNIETYQTSRTLVFKVKHPGLSENDIFKHICKRTLLCE